MKTFEGKPLIKRAKLRFETRKELDEFLASVKARPVEIVNGLTWSGRIAEDGMRWNMLITGGRLQGETTELRIVQYPAEVTDA